MDGVAVRVRDRRRIGLLVVERMSLDQKLSALEKANLIRSENARLKAELRDRDSLDSHGLAITVLMDLDAHESVRSMTVKDLLGAVRGVGVARVSRWLNRIGVLPSRRVRELSSRQVLGLTAELAASRDRIEKGRKNHGR